MPTAPSETPPAPRPAEAESQIPAATPGDLSTAPPLPEGPLLPVARDEHGETFLVTSRAAKSGDVADFWTYEAFIPAVTVGLGVQAVQGLIHHAVDCPSKTDQVVASAGYDETGAPVVALAAAPAEPLVEGSAYARIAVKVCAGVPIPTTGTLAGHTAALAEARQPPSP
ncbi:MAG: hypothetical protein ABSD80_09830 [Caulobacteraceae bacterium]